MKRSYKNLLGAIIAFIGVVVLLQASDLNPFLLIKSYAQWINTHYYNANFPERNYAMIFLTILLGTLLISAGVSMYKLPKKKVKGNSLISVTLPDTTVFKEPDRTMIKSIHLDKEKGEITMDVDFPKD